MSDQAEILLEELGLGSAPPAPKIPVYLRDLTADDLLSTSTRAEYGSNPPVSIIKKLRYPHHTLARLLAEGKSNPECSAITGYAVASIPIYLRDPAFRELVEYYKDQAGQKYLDVHERLAAVGTTALEIMQERLMDEDEAKKITIGQLREIVESAYDRSIAPNKSSPAFGNSQQPPNAGQTFHIHFGTPVKEGETGQAALPDAERVPMIDVTPK